MKTYIKNISAETVGQEVTLQWWVQNTRSSGKIAFIELRDGTGYIQCIIMKQKEWSTEWLETSKFETVEALGQESSLSLTGVISKHPKKEEYELQVSDVTIYQNSKDYPLGTKDDHGPEFLFDNRALYLRSKSQVAIMKIRDTIIHATYDWMRANDFIKIDAPIFTPNACEGTTELYEVEHVNGEKMYLSQSGQLYIEAAIFGHNRVFDFWPVFRAEQSKTRRHLNEFWMMDAEMAFATQEENMQVQEQLIYYIIQEVLTLNAKDLEILGRDTSVLQNITLPFPRVQYKDRVDELIKLWYDVKQWDDIGSDKEMQYCETITQPMFLTNFPKTFKSFYFKEDPANPWTVLGSDLLAPEGCGEVIWGGTREDSYEKLLQAIKDHNLPESYFDRYLDLRKYGSVPHGGFGYGLERIVRRLCGLHHIRETIPFPRYANRITP